jgi:hypothetical protein
VRELIDETLASPLAGEQQYVWMIISTAWSRRRLQPREAAVKSPIELEDG